MSLRTAFVWYVLVAAVIATIVCAFFINALDEYRISLFLKYQSRSQELEVPEGGSHIAYVTTDGAEAYVIYDADGNIVARGKVPYGEGHIEVGIGEESAYYSLFIVPEYDRLDTVMNRVCAVLQAASLPVCYLAALILCAVTFWRRRLRGPIVALDRASARIASNDLDFTLTAERDDELGRLTESFETMRASLEDSNRELWALMEERRRLNAAFAHDLRTPLTVLKGHADMLSDSLPRGTVTREEAADEIRVMRSHIARLEGYVDAMARLQRLEDVEIHRERVDAKRFAASLGDSAAIICSGLDVVLDSDTLPETVNIDTEVVMQVLENILSNAARYAKSRVTITLEANATNFTAKVADDGPGFSAEALAKASNPFYKGRESGGEHLGLGLNICDILCRRHGGNLAVSNVPAGGGMVTARFGM